MHEASVTSPELQVSASCMQGVFSEHLIFITTPPISAVSGLWQWRRRLLLLLSELGYASVAAMPHVVYMQGDGSQPSRSQPRGALLVPDV